MITNKISQNKIIICGLLIIIIVAAILALQTFHAPFFLDDIPELDHVSSFSSIKDAFSPDTFGLKRPIKNLIFMVVAQTGTDAIVTAHSILLILYITGIIISFFWFQLWVKNKNWAVAATGIWAVAPTMISSISWFSCANIMLSTIATLTGLICWESARIRQAEKDSKKEPYHLWIVTILAFIFAFNAYEATIIFPALIVIQDTIIRKRKWSRKLIIPYLIIGIVTLLLLFTRGKPAVSSNFGIMGITHNWQLSYASAFLILSHIKEWLWPFGSQEILGIFIWNRSASLWMLTAAWGILIIVGSISFIFRNRYPMIIAGLFWAIISLVPMCNVLPVRSGPFADYYLNLASIGLTLATIFTIKKLLQFLQQKNITNIHRYTTILIISALITIRIIGIIAAFNWSAAWSNPPLLLERSIRARPYAYHAQARLARIMLLNNQLEYAEKLAQQSLIETKDYILPRNVLGDVASKKNHFKESRKWYEQVLKIDNDNMYAHISLANLFSDHLKRKKLAEKHFNIVIKNQNNPYRETAYINLSIILGTDKRYEEAITLLKEALHNFPDSKPLQHNLQVTYKSSGVSP